LVVLVELAVDVVLGVALDRDTVEYTSVLTDPLVAVPCWLIE
jgi:hypothetical protein